ncbi:MAG: hypothetical protein ACOVO5_09650 [Devosia sp.]|jgi:hypothetical protein|uniref:hypothetical protein n=1 Tax=Devosia sp. TaxID=1871048 RepID=UPI0037C0EAB4
MRETLAEAIFRHPRRLGFIAFNLIAFALVITWILVTKDDASLGVFGLPWVALGYVGIGFLVVVWIVAWIAWIIMASQRRRRHRHEA